MTKTYTEDDINSALHAVVNGESVRKAALDFGIPRATLGNRINGHLSHKKGFKHMQKIAPIQEKQLADWILVQESLGTSPTHRQIREIGESLLDIRGSDSSLGKRWVQNFLSRNPEIKTKRQFKIDSARVSGATVDIISQWFPKLDLPAIKHIKPKNRYNMDEAGIMEGQGLNGLVLGSAEYRIIQKKEPGSRNWTSLIECVSAVGKALDPLIIYKGKSVQQQWFPVDLTPYKDWNFTATDNGWTTNATCLEWLKKVFIPQTTPSQSNEARLLILDGHGSHETTEFMIECFKHNIHLLFLPPHTSHILQPLDLSVFSPLKRSYRYYLNKLTSLSESGIIGKQNFLSCYEKARKDSLTVRNILAGWKASGLWPQNRTKPIMSRLLLENSNKEVLDRNLFSDDDPEYQWNKGASLVDLKTPQKASDLREYAYILTQEKETDLSTRRQLFRKITKAFDAKDHQIMQAEYRIKQLEYKLDQTIPRKRRMVKTSPNSKFSGIKAIKVAQIEAGDREIDIEDSNSICESDTTGDCIEVG